MLERSIADEVEAAIQAGSTEKHLDTLKQVTDLFLASADGYSGEQIELFCPRALQLANRFPDRSEHVRH